MGTPITPEALKGAGEEEKREARAEAEWELSRRARGLL